MTIDEIQSALRFDMDMQLFDGITGETHSKESLKYGNEMNYIHYCANEEAVELLEELKSIKEIDLEIPQHFTKEQSDWIKAYCIKRNKEFYQKGIDDFVEKLDKRFFGMEMSSGLPGEGVTWHNARKQLKDIVEQLKGENNE